MFPKSVVLHFPPEIYRSSGVSETAPQLLRALEADKVAAVQFLHNGRVRVTCKTVEYRDELLEASSFLYGDVSVPVTAADQHVRSVFVRDLPIDIPDADVLSTFQSFGAVHSVHVCHYRDFPSVPNGSRRLVMSFSDPIPSSVSVAKFPVRVWHAGQPVSCSICRQIGHLPQACPLSGLCRRCKQPGHVARECTRAWGPSRPVPSDPVVSATVSSSAPTSCASVPVLSPASGSSASSVPVSIPATYPACHRPFLVCHPFLCSLSFKFQSFLSLLPFLLRMERSLWPPSPQRTVFLLLRLSLFVSLLFLLAVYIRRLIIRNLFVL